VCWTSTSGCEPERKVTEGESCVARKKRRRESEHWAAAQHRVGKLFQGVEKRPRIIAVFDREGDIFEAFEALDQLGHSFIIRASHNRLVDSDGEGRELLARFCRAGTGRGSLHGQRASAARPSGTCGADGCPGHELGDPAAEKSRAARRFHSAQHCRGNREPASGGVEPLVWYLVTREPIETAADVLAVVRGYEARWIIEELHMGMKTGLLDGTATTRDRARTAELPRLCHSSGVADVVSARRSSPA